MKSYVTERKICNPIYQIIDEAGQVDGKTMKWGDPRSEVTELEQGLRIGTNVFIAV